MKKVFLRFYSSINLGDDLFVHILSHRYRNDFYVDRMAKYSVFSGYENIISAESFMTSTASRIWSRLRRKWRIKGQQKIASSQAVVYVGGSIFMEGYSSSRWQCEKDFFNSLQVPYFILGPNFGPYENESFKAIIRDIVAGSSDTCFRDAVSYDHFQDLPTARVASDIAFSLDITQFNLNKVSDSAVISVIDWTNRFDQTTGSRYETEIANLVSNLSSRGYKVTLMSFCKNEGDEKAIDRISKMVDCSISIYRYEGNITAALQVLASAEIVVGTRFHSIVLGLIFRCLVLPISYSDKTLNMLSGIGFRGPVLDINKIGDFDGKLFDFHKLQPQDISREESLAQIQFEKLDEILERKK